MKPTTVKITLTREGKPERELSPTRDYTILRVNHPTSNRIQSSELLVSREGNRILVENLDDAPTIYDGAIALRDPVNPLIPAPKEHVLFHFTEFGAPLDYDLAVLIFDLIRKAGAQSVNGYEK